MICEQKWDQLHRYGSVFVDALQLNRFWSEEISLYTADK